ncbi:hypothetical protein [Reyranella sp.]|jgi:hypothetical protein|uniref:hypothetical protein n=1 Tax=Reyranella sp. TaxID=1929291 RepID=UPI003BA85971
MTTRSTMQWMFVMGIAGLVAACGMAKSTPGEDPRTETNATQVTWTDGKPAIAISCKEPGACQTRAVAMCGSTGGDYKTLKMENMPTRGDMSEVRGAASVVIRCGA